MRDTPPEVDTKYRAMLLERSGEERLKMAGSMYATARALVVASVLEADPSASPTALRQALFLRFYGHEFDEPTRARILARLGAESESAKMTANPLLRPDIDSLLGADFSRVRAAFARTVTGSPFDWDRRLGKARDGEQTLLAHGVSVLDTLVACLPFVAEVSHPPLTKSEVRNLLVAAFVHDAGKMSEAFQAYLRGEGDPTEHVEPETIRSLAMAVAREADLEATGDDIVSQAVLHDRRMRRDRGELAERGRHHESRRWRTLADLVDAADSLASLTSTSEAEIFLRRNRQLIGGADVAAYHVRVRGVSTTFLHSAALDAFEDAGWTPLRYFEDGTVFVAAGSRPPDEDAVRRALEGKLEELISARAEQLPVLAVGGATQDFLPSPEYVTEQNVDHLFDVAASRVRAKTKIGDAERQRWSKQWVDGGLREHESVKAIFGETLSDHALEVLASSGPEICLLKLFKNLMDPAKGLCDSTDEEMARGLYETSVGKGTYASMRQQSTYMLVENYKQVLAAWHRLEVDGAPGSAPLRLANLDPKARQKRIRDELVRITKAVLANRRSRGGGLPADRLASDWARSILADLSFERTGQDAEIVRQNLLAYAALKAKGVRRSSKPALQCVQCSDTIEAGAEEEPSDALGNIGSFSNRRTAFDVPGSPPVCPTCTVDLKLARLCLGGPVRTVIALVPLRGFTPPDAAHLVEVVQDLKRTVDRQLSPETLELGRYVALSLPHEVLRQDSGTPLAERLVLPVSPKTIKEREKRLTEALRERLGGDDGVAELGRELRLPITSAVDLAKALVEGTAPAATRDDPDVTAALRHTQRDVLVEFAAVTPNLVIVALDREIAADREADRALYQFGLAALFNRELDAAVLVASPGELRTAVASRLGRAVYVPSNGPTRRLLGADWLPAERAGTWLRALQAAIALGPWLGGDVVGPYGVLKFRGAGFAIRRAERIADKEPYWPTLWPHIEALKEVLG